MQAIIAGTFIHTRAVLRCTRLEASEILKERSCAQQASRDKAVKPSGPRDGAELITDEEIEDMRQETLAEEATDVSQPPAKEVLHRD